MLYLEFRNPNLAIQSLKRETRSAAILIHSSHEIEVVLKQSEK